MKKLPRDRHGQELVRPLGEHYDNSAMLRIEATPSHLETRCQMPIVMMSSKVPKAAFHLIVPRTGNLQVSGNWMLRLCQAFPTSRVCLKANSCRAGSVELRSVNYLAVQGHFQLPKLDQRQMFVGFI